MEEIKVNHIKYSLDPKKANNMKKKKEEGKYKYSQQKIVQT